LRLSAAKLARALFKDFLINRTAWRNGLVLPIYVPSDLHSARALLAEGQLQNAAAALWKLSSLGSNSAAALLAYLCLRDGALCGSDRAAISEQCLESANRRHGFAQFVVGWSEHEKGNYKRFEYWLLQAAKGGFPPAMGDMGRMLISPTEKKRRNPKLSKRFFLQAIRRGHVLSVQMFMYGCWRGAYGPIFRMIGILGLPLSVLLTWTIMWFRPFGLSVFAYPAGSSRPLFNPGLRPW
jgi:TPR repeat protein